MKLGMIWRWESMTLIETRQKEEDQVAGDDPVGPEPQAGGRPQGRR